jgi:hypothetical protein
VLLWHTSDLNFSAATTLLCLFQQRTPRIQNWRDQFPIKYSGWSKRGKSETQGKISRDVCFYGTRAILIFPRQRRYCAFFNKGHHGYKIGEISSRQNTQAGQKGARARRKEKSVVTCAFMAHERSGFFRGNDAIVPFSTA